MPFGIGYLVKTWLGDLMERRQSQINQSTDQLYRLSKLRHDCPSTVIDFLLMTHRVNQCRTDALAYVGSTEVRSTLIKHLDDIEKDLNRIEEVLDSKQPCIALSKIVLLKVSESDC
tara:strand:+ start:2851 stop:3198 length:348 start_codon:yes stop_codon:yes gene_type:complete